MNIHHRTPRFQPPWVATVLLGFVAIVGCDDTLAPGTELYVLKNPTRSWKIPEPTVIDLATAPLIVANNTEHQFGIIEPNVEVQQEFSVRNDGKSPLTLTRTDEAPSIASYSESVLTVDPSDSASVKLGWTPDFPGGETDAVAKFRTNDPRRPILSFCMSGTVRSSLFADPPGFYARRVRPDQSANMTVLVCSQRWKMFDLANVESNLPGLTWKTERAEPEQLEAAGAKCGWVVHAQLPAGLPPGEIVGKSLTLCAQPSDKKSNSRELQIPINAKVLRQVAVYGKDINKQGTITMGVLPLGVEHRREFTVKVHDSEPALSVRNISVLPDFLKVRLEPYDDLEAPENLYRLEIVLPATAAPSVYRGSQLGQIRFEFDHPRIDELSLQVEFLLLRETRRDFSVVSNAH